MKKAFSLIELLIVIVIIGVVYTLAISKLKSVGEEISTPTLANLKEYMQGLNKEHKTLRLLCLDDCEECVLYEDGKEIQKLENFVQKSVMRYRYDFLQGAVALRDEIYFDAEGNDKNVCFSFSIDKNNISDQIIVDYKERVYDYTSYFDKTKVYESMEDLMNEKEKHRQEVMQ